VLQTSSPGRLALLLAAVAMVAGPRVLHAQQPAAPATPAMLYAQPPASPATTGSPLVTLPGTAGPLARTAPADPGTVEVAARDLARGEVLTPEDIARVAAPEEDVARVELPRTLVGWRTRRVISAGEPLRPPAVSPPDLVQAGESVQVLYQGPSVVLRVNGTAAGSAAMGERVLVRVDARRRLEGVVIGPGLVQLEMNESS
jgi:flagella basal body P-ring formation protein FlgA